MTEYERIPRNEDAWKKITIFINKSLQNETIRHRGFIYYLKNIGVEYYFQYPRVKKCLNVFFLTILGMVQNRFQMVVRLSNSKSNVHNMYNTLDSLN